MVVEKHLPHFRPLQERRQPVPFQGGNHAWKEKCPIKAFRSYLAERRLFTEEELDAAVKEAAAVIDHAVEYGKASKNPSVDDVFDDVYA